MNDFWDSFTVAADSNIETMGEEVMIGGRAVIRGVVQPVEVSPGIVTGGQSAGVTHSIQVSLADGEGIADGDKVVTRLLTGAVISKIHFGGGWQVNAGPANRYREDDF